MPEYVYALHDFLPEHEDEVSFHAGERIEVVEKDDLYGDGWWQGRNLAGKVGLFPVSYTAPAPPATTTVSQPTPSTSSSTSKDDEEPSTIGTNGSKTVLQTLAEESESGTPPPPDIVSPVPKQPPAAFLNGEGYESDFGNGDDASLHLGSMPDGEVMKATMTDVQKAIEQLGRGVGQEDGDGARSFSFASTREGDTETDTDFDLSDIDGGADEANGEDWHKNARMKLAAKASRAIAEAEKLEAMMSSNDSSSIRRSIAPPIEVELSDESEDEGDFTRSSKFQRNHPNILEEDENEEADVESSLGHAKEPSGTETETQGSSTVENQVTLPPKDESELPTATAAQTSFPVFTAPPRPQEAQPPTEPVVLVEQPTPSVTEERPVSPAKEIYPKPASPPPIEAVRSSTPTTNTTTQEQKRSSAPVNETAVTNGLPSPSTSTHFNNAAVNSKHNSIVSSASAPAMTTPAPPMQQSLSAASTLKKNHPSEWTLEEVIEWLKSKGFDQDVCDKFVEQEITGDVLLELDANLLKTEIGIMAFGKRVRIANAIAELRRPPSVDYYDNNASSGHPSPSPLQLQHSNSHSRTQSQSHSHNSYLGTISAMPSQGYTQSIQSSLGSPMGVPANGYYAANQFEPVQEMPMPVPAPAPVMENGLQTTAAAGALGIGLPSSMVESDTKNRAGHLAPSPSDGALKDTAVKSSKVSKVDEEDRGHMSDGEIAPTATSMRRRLFGRSQDSTQSYTAANRQSPIPSPTPDANEELTKKNSVSSKDVKEKVKDKESRDSSSIGSGSRHRAKKSIDGSKHSDRLSIFGTTFSGSLGGKSRKPPPVAYGDDHSHDRTSKFSLPRLGGSSIRKASSNSNRPTTPNLSPKEVGLGYDSSNKEQEKETLKNSNTLRKRTVSAPHHPVGASVSQSTEGAEEPVNGATGMVKQGQSILEQIGEPDHVGWMRKKGDRYNSWKLRYFVLKGPHLYILRSNNKSETKIKGYIHIQGYKVTVDETVDPGRYGFRIDHDHDKTHYFSSEEKSTIREWMKAIMKATIGRDYSKPVVSSCNIPTIPLVVAQAMNPAPRPPSPTAREATQKALRREHPDQLSSRDARVLMGLNSSDGKDERTRLDSFFSEDTAAATVAKDAQPPTPRRANAPPRPSREMRRSTSQRVSVNNADEALIKWANTHLPENLQITDPSGPLCGGLGLLRLAESIKGRPSSPPVPDSAFPTDPNDDKLDGLFRLFDFLLDNEVKMGSVSINDVRQGKRDKILQLLRALKAWEDKRRAIANTIARGSIPANAGGFMLPVVIS
ncbi:hypothetical protein D9613_004857 [Agrocybe pediades]|uniref:Uncharacterized protein n=1 Tax=Agrocybe pediades TaxID=84607 RepID=A0A8H4QYZ7_9AGAR|nr:hypothetical protein D9613_004857 [Agrocybe pediades]